MTATLPGIATELDADASQSQVGAAFAGRLDKNTIRAFLRYEIDADALPAPKFGPIGETVFNRTYARPVEMEDGTFRNEVWAETARRVVLGNLAFAPADVAFIDEATELFELLFNFKVTPAGRHLWTTGTNLVYNRNCFLSPYAEQTSLHTAWTAQRLFEGGGVGGNYSDDLIAITKPILGSVEIRVVCDASHPNFDLVRETAGTHFAALSRPRLDETLIVVDDSREGWVDLWSTVIDTATEVGTHKLLIDVSGIREYGAPLVTFGGQASGPEPLVRAALEMAATVNGATGRQLDGLEFMELDHSAASAVVAGGTRRSARMSLKLWSDPDIFKFISLKSDTDGHWTTNISVETNDEFKVALDNIAHPLHEHANKVVSAIAKGIAINGEPGMVDTSAHSVGEPVAIRGVNPCAEVSLNPGESCNIGSVNLDAFGQDFDGAARAFEMMARFLYRATIAPYPDALSAEIEGRNRRIGLGILGFQGWVAAHGTKLSEFASDHDLRAQLSHFRVAARKAADAIADALGMPRSVKVMAIAPTGSISQLSGATAGIHPVNAKHYYRLVRYASTDPQLIELERQGFMVEDDLVAANTKVVRFVVKDGILDRFPEELIEDSTEIDFDQFMTMVKAVQDTLLHGTDGNAVSATAQIPAGMDPDELALSLRKHIGNGLKGITAFPAISIPQAPIQNLTKAQYEAALAEVGENAAFYAAAYADSNDGNCGTGACPVR